MGVERGLSCFEGSGNSFHRLFLKEVSSVFCHSKFSLKSKGSSFRFTKFSLVLERVTMSSVDQDRPSTWVPYREGLCQSCISSCCTMPVEVQASDLVRLGLATEDEVQISKKKVFKKLRKEKIVSSYREGTDLYMLQSTAQGACPFLHPQTRLCTVYERRPEVCRKFPSIGPKPGFCPYRRRTSG